MDDRIEDPLRTPRELSSAEARPAARGETYIELARNGVNRRSWRELHWTGSLAAYLGQVRQQPRLARNAYQRLYDMIVGFGLEQAPLDSGRPVHYAFFDDPFDGGKDAVFGLARPLAELVSHLRAAAHGLGPERRVLLMHGPVGSAKSTIARLMKRGLADYSARPEGALFSYRWRIDGELHDCPMHEDPLHLLPADVQEPVFDDLNARFDGDYPLRPTGGLCPFCRYWSDKLLADSNGDFAALERAVEVYRFTLSEQDRVGIGTFQPKDEKNQDSTELTGDINYRRIAEYGSDSDPRAFNFDGEFHVANRGLIEFIELLKLDVAFLYDLLGATQEHSVKPKKFGSPHVLRGESGARDRRRACRLRV
ncbi:MAG: hypothetical protein DRQ55_08090 [Planctomycetota bacterium]|nr:MAG: hypothetical protein DRQ55_08090 [Planctomycetota bacterium]